MSDLNKAIALAVEAHAGQIDKADAPYILHPLRVMLAMKTDEERIVAVLHDVAEDCISRPLEYIAKAGFSAQVVEALDALTRRHGETYSAFIERCGANPLARRVKLADLADNMDLARFRSPSPEDRKRWLKYDKAERYLSSL